MIRRVYQRRLHPLPFSLHDSRICGIELKEDRLLLKFEYGFIKIGDTAKQTEGDVEITGIDLDSSSVYLMEYTDVLCGNEGHFKGEKVSLEKFISREEIHMDVMDEAYGDNQIKLSGYLSIGDIYQECMIEIYYLGDFWYRIEEKNSAMAELILSADGDLSLYSVPEAVVKNIEMFSMEFDRWMRSSPYGERYREELVEDGMSYTCVQYDETDFIQYLNQYVFPEQPSALLEWVCRFDDEIPKKYEGIPWKNF